MANSTRAAVVCVLPFLSRGDAGPELHNTAPESAFGAAVLKARAYPSTPDGRYFIVAGRLWRATNPALPEERRQQLVAELMHARRAVHDTKRDKGDLKAARERVNTAKIALGERGPVWWQDGAPDYNRHMAKNTPYAEWAAAL